jgi:hypothetical protein
MSNNFEKASAVASANAIATSAGLPTYSELVEALRKAEAVLSQIQDVRGEAGDIVKQGYFGHAVVRGRALLARIPA